VRPVDREEGDPNEHVRDALEADHAASTTREWLEHLSEDEPVNEVTTDEIVSLIHEGRAERDEQIRGALLSTD
jgi:hypothetical protein